MLAHKSSGARAYAEWRRSSRRNARRGQPGARGIAHRAARPAGNRQRHRATAARSRNSGEGHSLLAREAEAGAMLVNKPCAIAEDDARGSTRRHGEAPGAGDARRFLRLARLSTRGPTTTPTAHQQHRYYQWFDSAGWLAGVARAARHRRRQPDRDRPETRCSMRAIAFPEPVDVGWRRRARPLEHRYASEYSAPAGTPRRHREFVHVVWTERTAGRADPENWDQRRASSARCRRSFRGGISSAARERSPRA